MSLTLNNDNANNNNGLLVVSVMFLNVGPCLSVYWLLDLNVDSPHPRLVCLHQSEASITVT